MQRYIIFKDGKAWKGFFAELDAANELQRAFDNFKQEAIYKNEEELQIRFFKKYRIVKWSFKGKRYLSAMLEFIIGNPAKGECGVVVGIDELTRPAQFFLNIYSEEIDSKLRKGLDCTPQLSVSRGTKALS